MEKQKRNLMIAPVSKFTSLKKIVENKDNNCALLLGNGINYRYFKSTAISWNQLVAEIWNQSHKQMYYQLSENIFKECNISLTQTVEMSESILPDIRKGISNTFSKIPKNSPSALKFITALREKAIPVLTTNYDMNLEHTLGCRMYNCSDSKRLHWSRYYSDLPLKDPKSGFGIWHIHGDINHSNEICITMSDYLNAFKKAAKMIDGISAPFVIGETKRKPEYQQSWLSILFEKDICIIGLGLEENETFLRWLLMQRAIFINKSIRHKGWYLYVEDQKKEGTVMSKAKLFFLRSVGIEPVKCANYYDMYNL